VHLPQPYSVPQQHPTWTPSHLLVHHSTRYIELIAVGQHAAALEALHDVIISKRSRSVPLASLEPIMLKFVELCVTLRKGKIAKEGLHQYKNISQNTSIATIEVNLVPNKR
jgi:hypothetical protein